MNDVLSVGVEWDHFTGVGPSSWKVDLHEDSLLDLVRYTALMTGDGYWPS